MVESGTRLFKVYLIAEAGAILMQFCSSLHFAENYTKYLSVVVMIAYIVAYFSYIGYLGKAKKMLY